MTSWYKPDSKSTGWFAVIILGFPLLVFVVSYFGENPVWGPESFVGYEDCRLDPTCPLTLKQHRKWKEHRDLERYLEEIRVQLEWRKDPFADLVEKRTIRDRFDEIRKKANE